MMPFILKDADIFFHGTKYESFGIVLIEAMPAGVPYIINVGGISELIKNKENGILVNYDDSKSFAENAIELSKNSKLRKI